MTRGIATESKVIPAPSLTRRKSRVVAIIQEIEDTGLNLAEVARRLNEPKESVSYIYRSSLEKKGYAVQACPDLGALGLRDATAVVDIEDRYSQSVGDVFDDMDGHWFLVGFSRTLPDGKYILHFALPEGHYEEFPELLERVKQEGLIPDVHQTLRFSWHRHLPMRADLFDFKRGRWEFDWTQLPPEEEPEFRSRTPNQKFDATDIAMLGHMIADAASPLNDIARRVRVSSKTAYRHAQHISDGRMVRRHGINWLKNTMNTELGKPYARHHRFALMNINVTGVTPQELRRLRSKLCILPFVWFEAGGNDYLAELGIPLEQMVETMSYLREVLEPVAGRSKSHMTDAAHSRSYPPPKFVVEPKGSWEYDLDQQMSVLRGALKTLRGEGRVNEVKATD